MSIHHRSAHVPLAYARQGSSVIIITDVASATYNLESNDVDQVITNWEKFTVTTAEQFAPKTISYKKYGTKEYHWFICWYNGIINPTRELVAGLEIKLPDFQQMITYLSRSTNQNTPEYVRI